MLKIPIFCLDDSEAALPCNQLYDPLTCLEDIVGIKEILNSYCFRHGTANVVDCKLFIAAWEGDHSC